jgi:hypothetical protein
LNLWIKYRSPRPKKKTRHHVSAPELGDEVVIWRRRGGISNMSERASRMIRVERGAEISPGVFAYTVPSLGLSGRSRQPLLDACRQIKSLLGPTGQLAGLFREGSSDWDIRCTVAVGAELTIKEESKGGIRIAKHKPFTATFREAAERAAVQSKTVVQDETPMSRTFSIRAIVSRKSRRARFGEFFDRLKSS